MVNWIYQGGAYLTPKLNSMLHMGFSGSDWFIPLYQRMWGLAVVLYLPFLLLALMQGVLARDSGLLLRAAFVSTPTAIVLTGAVVSVTASLMAVADGFSSYMLDSLGASLVGLLTHTGAVLAAAAAGSALTGAGSAVFVAMAVAVTSAILLIILELLVRQAAIYICLLFLPLTAAAGIWPWAAHLTRRLIQVLIGLVWMRFVITVILVMGAAAFAASPLDMGPLGDGGFETILMGAVVIVIAALSPFALMRLIPLAETAIAAGISTPLQPTVSRVPQVTAKKLHAMAMARLAGDRSGRASPPPGAPPTGGPGPGGRSGPSVGGRPPTSPPGSSPRSDKSPPASQPASVAPRSLTPSGGGAAGPVSAQNQTRPTQVAPTTVRRARTIWSSASWSERQGGETADG